jgi:hypothetical protein
MLLLKVTETSRATVTVWRDSYPTCLLSKRAIAIRIKAVV